MNLNGLFPISSGRKLPIRGLSRYQFSHCSIILGTNILMKNLIPVLLTACLLFSGCKTDVCEGLVCENNGICEGGFCDCPDGYVGQRCEIEINACDLKQCNATGTDTCIISPVTGEARCVCASGFEGDKCEARWEAKYTGNYLANEICDGLSGNFPMSVQVGPDPGQVTLVNFSNEQPNNIPAKVVGILLTGTAFRIYQQFMAFGEVEGQGGLRQDGAIEYSYTVIQNGDTSSCSVLLTPN